MHNTYFSSTIYAVKCKESFSLSFNGYSNFLYERFDRAPSHCSSCCVCCDCCALSTYRVPIKPSLLNGLRQSTLLQLSASRRFLLGRDQYFSRLPAFGLHRGCYDLTCCINERTCCSRSTRRVEGKCVRAGAASRKGRENYHSFGSDDTEAVLSLLSKESDKDVTDIWKNVSSSKRTEVEKKIKNVNRERNLSLSKTTGAEKKGILKQRETSTIDLRVEDEKSSRGREALTKSEGNRRRRDVSSCSSYYSLSSGDFGSDVEFQDKHGLEELSAGYKKDEANYVEGQVKEEYNRQRDDSEKLQDVSKHERTAFGADIDWSLRKKSEKKLAEVTVQETKATKEQQDMHSKAFRTHEASHGKASISHDQVDSKEDNSSFVKGENAYIQTGNRKHHYTDIHDSAVDEVEATLMSQKAFTGRHGKLELSDTQLKETNDEREIFVASTSTTGKETLKSKKTSSGRQGNLGILETTLQETNDEHKKFAGSTSITGKDVINRSSQKYIENPKIEDAERMSNTGMKSLGAKKVSVLSPVQGVEEQQHQKGEKTLLKIEEKAQTNERRKSQQFSEVSQVHWSNVEDTSIIKSRTKIKNSEENSSVSSDARATWQQTDKRTAQNIQHKKGSELVGTSSEGYTGDEKQVSSSQRTFEKVRLIPKSKLTAAVKTREASCQTDETIINFELASEDRRARKVSISDKTASREESSFQGSQSFVFEAGKHAILTDDDERSSEIILIPSSSQVIGGGSAHVELAAGTASPKIFLETSESGSSAMYDISGRSPALLQYSRDGSDQAHSEHSNIMAPEDSLGSADRLEKSSKQFVDEFVEKVRHEATTSGTLEMEGTEAKLAFEDEGNQIYNSRGQATQNDSQSKEHDSSCSSGPRGTKGPSDEMWAVTEPSVEQSQIAEESEVSKETVKPIVSRTGRSLWSMIADVVRLRWGSRAASSVSAERSGERNSPNKSDSETWFSGQEHEEMHKSNVIKETSVLPEAMTSDKLKLGKHFAQSEGEMSDTKRIKDKGKRLEVGSSASNRVESRSVVAPYASVEENIEWTEDGKDLKVNTSGTTNMDLPSALPARRPPIAGAIVNIGVLDLSGTESVVPIKEPVAPVQFELSDSRRKDGELKQRKFQRNKQVLRDRFDDWEEAYKLELEQRTMDEIFMKEALLEAKKAADIWEVPVGAVLVQHGKIIARGCNLVEELRDSTAHAEMICIREASNLLRTWRLSDTTLYVTLEPCPMCAGAILQARVDTVVWGAPNKLLGADGSWIRLLPEGGESASESRDIPPAPVHPFHPKIKIRRGVLANECADVMQQFFQLRRKKKKEETPKEPSCLPITHPHNTKFLNKIHDIFHVMFCLYKTG